MADQVTEMRGNAPRGPRRGRAARAITAALGAMAILASPAVARAQAQTFYLDRLFMAGAPDDAIGVWRPQMGEKTRFYGQLGFGFGFEPFRMENEIKSPLQRSFVAQRRGQPVKHQLITYGDVGVEILDRFAFQVQLPGILYQAGSATNDPTGKASEANMVASPTSPAALMDLRLDARAVVYRNDSRSFKLGAEAGVWIPTGNRTAYGSDGSASGSLGLSIEGDWKKFFLTSNLGFQFRPTGAVNSFLVKNEFRYAVGVFAPIRDGRIRIGGEIFGSVGLSGGKTYPVANLPLEWMAEGRFALGEKKRGWLGVGGGTRLTPGYSPDFRLVALVGYAFNVADTDPPSPGKRFKAERFAEHGADTDHDKIPDDIDLCPTEPEDGKPPNPDDGCPALPDRDGDGIPDNVDKCPDNPEDFDGIQDADGCPEDDADKDGIPDAQDACPKEPGDADPDPKKNGCPKFIRRISGSTEIQLLKNIEFATGKAVILNKSFPIVDEVVRLMKVNQDIKHLAIEGHTDNRGSDELNERLSNDRANAVMKYLVEHGIDGGRLSAKGYGPKRPLADNNTNDGRQRNRRVEFHITDQAGVTGDKPEGAAPASQ
ncbi:Flagellar motor rotation protein MotB [Minicystis rosea]|nr:Flagellar motor rotation protein MotB [Minicystis rosea]